MLSHRLDKRYFGPMTKGWAKLAISDGLSVWVLEAPDGFGDARFHSHHAIQITAALSGKLSLETRGKKVDGKVIAVASDVDHRFEASGLIAFVFVAPEGLAGRGIAAELLRFEPLSIVDCTELQRALEPLKDTFAKSLGSDDLLTVGRTAIERFLPKREVKGPDPRVQKIIDHALTNLDQPLSIAAASQGVFLSPDRLRHLFAEQTGLPYRTYLVWLRLTEALRHYSDGRSLTQSAHAAGFADSAHFSRVFRRTFGLPATTLTRL